jgi:cytochrome c551/c552
VARKHAGEIDAKANLNLKVKMGGVGLWGHVPTPSYDTAFDEDIEA